MLTIANMNQDIETPLKWDKSEGAMAPLGPIVAMPMLATMPTSRDLPIFCEDYRTYCNLGARKK